MRAVLGLALLRPWGPAVMRGYMAALWPGLPDARDRAARLVRLLRRPGRWAAFRATARTDHRVVEPWFEALACPALVVMGADDPDWKEPAAEAAWAAAAASGSGEEASILMVSGAGHAPMLERPEAVGPGVVDFVRCAAGLAGEAESRGGVRMPRAGLSADRVVAQAERIIDEQGVQALTLSRLAAELGVAPPSLYKHVGGLDDVAQQVALRAIGSLADALAASVMGLAGRDALVALAGAYRAFAHDHPGLYPMTQGVTGDTDALGPAQAQRTVEIVTAALAGYRLPADRIIDAVRMTRSALHGFVDIELHGGFAMAEPVDESFELLTESLDAALARLGDSDEAPAGSSASR